MPSKVAGCHFLFLLNGGNLMKILMIGDVVGKPGCRTLLEYLPKLKDAFSPDFIIVNGENAADNGRGITQAITKAWFECGIDAITLGNHTWAKPEIFDFIDDEPRIIRPLNYPIGTPGRGYSLLSTDQGQLVAVISLMGRSYMSPLLRCPFDVVDQVLKEIPPSTIIVVDFHAETTSEKQSLAWYLDGRVSAVMGTHTHVQTADERILKKGTAYITDVGMVGPYDGVIGMKKDAVIRRFLTQLPVRLEVEGGRNQLNAVYLEIDPDSKKTKKIDRVHIDDRHPFID